MSEAREQPFDVSASIVGPLVATARVWRMGARPLLTVCAKATFGMQHGGAMVPREPAPFGRDPRDDVVYRARADVAAVGTAHHPLLRLAVGRGPVTLLDKTVRWQPAPPGTPGGQAFVPHRFAGFSPAPLAPEITARLDAPGPLLLPEVVDWSRLQQAPADQQIGYLHGDEWLALDGFHPRQMRVQTLLPQAHVEARIVTGAARPRLGYPVPMMADGLLVDADAWLCHVTWRGSVPMQSPDALRGVWLAVGIGVAGVPIDWHGVTQPELAAAARHDGASDDGTRAVAPALLAQLRARPLPWERSGPASTSPERRDLEAGTRQLDGGAVRDGSAGLPWERQGETAAMSAPAAGSLPWERPGHVDAPEAPSDSPADTPDASGATAHLAGGALPASRLPWERPLPSVGVAAPRPPDPLAAEVAARPAPGEETAHLEASMLHRVSAPFGLAAAGQAAASEAIAGAPWATAAAAAVLEATGESDTRRLDRAMLRELAAGTLPASLAPAPGLRIPRRAGALPAVVTEGAVSAATLIWALRPPAPSLTLAAKLVLSLAPSGELTPLEPEPIAGPAFRGDDPRASLLRSNDLVVFKAKADATLVGHAHALGGPVTSLRPRFELGHRDNGFARELLVFGDRTWRPGARLSELAPAPFTTMPLIWERAYGGPGLPDNPVGIGHGAAYDRPTAMPNIVAAREDIDTSHAARPASFAPLPLAWRLLRAGGTYDEAWLERRWPHWPDDFDHGALQAAPAEQLLAYLRGDEPFRLVGLHPEVEVIQGALPSLAVRGYAQRTGAAGGDFVEVTMRLDSVAFDLDRMRVELIWRGVLDVADLRAGDVASLFVTVTPLAVEMTADEARQRHQRRLAALDPDGSDAEDEAADGPTADHTPAAVGGGERPAVPSSRHEARRASAAAVVRALDARGPAARGIAWGVAEPDHLGTLPASPIAEAPRRPDRLGPASRGGAQPSADPAAGARREAWAHRLRQGDRPRPGALAGEDLRGVDLSGCDLAGIDLRGAVLAGANLRAADLTGALLAAADLSGAVLETARLSRADLTGADLRATNLHGALLDGASLTRCRGEQAVLRNASGRDATFDAGHWAGARFEHAELCDADFTEALLDEAVFDGAGLERVRLLDARGRDVSFVGTNLSEARADGAELPGAVLDEANLTRSAWEAACLEGGRFTRARGAGAGFVEARCARARFEGAHLEETRFTRASLVAASFAGANLHHASFEGADLSDADLRGANVYGADAHGARTDRLRLEGSLLARSGFEPASQRHARNAPPRGGPG